MNSFLDVTRNLFNFTPDQWGWWVLAIVDILFLAFIIYQIYRILIKTKATQLLQGLFILAAIYLVAAILKLDTVLWLINKLGLVIIIVVVIIFQPELRKIFTQVARGGFFKIRRKAKSSIQIDAILDAAIELSQLRRGALIVFERRVSLKDICDTGTKLNADISRSLLVTIFQFDTALHDGALIIKDGRIDSAGCFLPLSEQSDIKKTFGTRHRAAIGISEASDAITLVCSEESGAISLTYESNLYYNLTPQEIKRTLLEYLEENEMENSDIVGEAYEE